MNIFRYDSPLMQFLSRAADLIWVNLLVLICSLPVFTIGASLSAMENIIYKILHNEDVSVTKEFFQAFGKNFKQATVIWLIILAVEGVLGYDFYYSRQIGTNVSEVMLTVAVILFVLVYAMMLYIFPLQSHYYNKTKDLFKNAAILVIVHPVRTIIMLAIQAIFMGIGFLIVLDYRFIPVLVCFCISLPWYFCACVHMPVFDKLDGVDKFGNKIGPETFKKESDSTEETEEPDPETSDEDESEEPDGEEEDKSES
ncbi:MAG: DUF624 domain-containing protein [Saccharofermentans sp.]|nr:DUF624 domain-containing protein [Saccharofermentans sp.]